MKDWANGWAANTAILAGVIALGAACLVFAPCAAAVGVAVGGGVAAGVGAAAGVMAIASGIFWKVNSDPPDPDYRTVYVPVPVVVPAIVAGNGLSAAAADALETYAADAGEFVKWGRGFYISINRAQGAEAAADGDSYDRQVTAAQSYASKAAAALRTWGASESGLRAALDAAGLANQAFPAAAVGQGQDLLSTSGIPAALDGLLDAAGATADEKGTVLGLGVYDAPADTDLYTLVDPIPGAAGILANLAGAFDAFAASPALPPRVSGFSPRTGPEAGGTQVSISGSNLASATDVRFGAVPATVVSCSASSCTVTSPAGSGTAPVTVTTPAGTSQPAPYPWIYVTTPAGPSPTPTPAPTPKRALPAGTLLHDGGFEPAAGLPDPSSGGGEFETLCGTSGSGRLGAWLISTGCVDLVSNAFADEGRQFIDLNGNGGPGPAAVTQSVPTVPGHIYQVLFSLAANANGAPAVKTGNATFGREVFAFSVDNTGHTPQSLGWAQRSFTATADSGTTTLAFTSTVAGTYGPLLDTVAVLDTGSTGPFQLPTTAPRQVRVAAHGATLSVARVTAAGALEVRTRAGSRWSGWHVVVRRGVATADVTVLRSGQLAAIVASAAGTLSTSSTTRGRWGRWTRLGRLPGGAVRSLALAAAPSGGVLTVGAVTAGGALEVRTRTGSRWSGWHVVVRRGVRSADVTALGAGQLAAVVATATGTVSTSSTTRGRWGRWTRLGRLPGGAVRSLALAAAPSGGVLTVGAVTARGALEVRTRTGVRWGRWKVVLRRGVGTGDVTVLPSGQLAAVATNAAGTLSTSSTTRGRWGRWTRL